MVGVCFGDHQIDSGNSVLKEKIADWPNIPLENVLGASDEQIETDPTETYRQITVRMWGNGVVLRGEVTGAELGSSRWFVARWGQFILSRIDARHGAFGLVPEGLDGAIVSNDFPLFFIDETRLLPEFLHWLSKTASFIELCRGASEGTTNRVRLKIDRFLASKIPLPPLDEQRRIVAHIEALAARITEARGLCRGAVDEAENILNAERNRIVRTLRQQNLDTDLGTICTKIKDGPHVSPSYVPEGIPFISARNVREDGLDFSTATYITQEDHELFSQTANVEFGDVIYVKVGATIGVARRVETETEFSIWVNVALLKPIPGKAISGFIEHMLNSPSIKAAVLEQTRGSATKVIGLAKISKIRVPVPHIDEQQRIVDYLDELQARIGILKHLQAETAAELDALLPSVLDRAFKGEL